jgi:DNA-binding response OmpR family regulator
MRLLLVEDDALIVHELLLRWQARGWMVTSCTSLEAASRACADSLVAGGFELVVLDLGLPDGDGLRWLAGMRRRDRLTPVMVLTARDQVVDRVRGLQVGADDYLVKPFAVDELDARIEALCRRGQTSRGEVLQYGSVSWLAHDARAYVDGQALELLPREFEVLGLLLRRAPHLVPKRALIDALAESNLELNDAAVELYVSRLRRKLVGSGTAIRTMRGFGYFLTLDTDEARP